MNDRQHDPYDPYAGQYEIVGYDAYGQPVYQQVAPQQVQQPPQPRPPQPPPLRQPAQPPQQSHAPQQYDPYAQGPGPGEQQGYGYDPYGAASGTGQQPPVQGFEQQRQYGGGAGHNPLYDTGYDPYGQAAGTGQQPRVDEQSAWVPQQHRPEPPAQPQPPQPPRPEAQAGGSGPGAPAPAPEYRTEQFHFIEEPDEDSEDVIDWLKFTESRTERREEAKRRGRNRVIALVVVLALALTGGVGYLWYAGKLPGMSGPGAENATEAGPQQRDVLVVHLHNTKGRGTSTALLVDNTTTEQGATVLLPNALSVTDEDGNATTLGSSVDEDGTGGTRDAIDSLLGTRIEGTWRLDTPYLDSLVELVGDIEINTNVDVPDPKAKRKGEAPLVNKGKQQTLSGPMAVAYATYRAPGEDETAQLARFGAVLQGVLRKVSTDPQAATTTVETLAQILDPSLKEKDLGASLAKLAARAKGGDYKTSMLPVQQDGTLTEQATDHVIKDVLGGKVKNPDQGAAVRVNVSGEAQDVQSARVDLVNGGYAVVKGGTPAGALSRVSYADHAQKAQATEVAKTLNLPTTAVRKGKVAANAEISVVLGGDYKE